jgi:hypothetical protein
MPLIIIAGFLPILARWFYWSLLQVVFLDHLTKFIFHHRLCLASIKFYLFLGFNFAIFIAVHLFNPILDH